MGAVEQRATVIGLTFDRPLRTVACLGAHADDIEIGAAATISILAGGNPDVTFWFAVATGDDTRAGEAATSAAKLLGDRVTVEIGGFTDGFLPYEDPASVKRFLRSASRAADADLVICPATRDRHQDHRFVAEVAHQLAREQPILEYEIQKYDGDLGRPGVYVPLTTGQAMAKLDHLDHHFSSQHAKPWYDREALQSLLRIRGVECRAPDGYAEAFHAARIVIR